MKFLAILGEEEHILQIIVDLSNLEMFIILDRPT
jgi:hypothetical protein